MGTFTYSSYFSEYLQCFIGIQVLLLGHLFDIKTPVYPSCFLQDYLLVKVLSKMFCPSSQSIDLCLLPNENPFTVICFFPCSKNLPQLKPIPSNCHSTIKMAVSVFVLCDIDLEKKWKTISETSTFLLA